MAGRDLPSNTSTQQQPSSTGAQSAQQSHGHSQADWSTPARHTTALATLSRAQAQLDHLRNTLPSLLQTLAFQTTSANHNTTPSTLYASFEETALRAQADVRGIKQMWQSEEVRGVLDRVEEREDGLGNDNIFGDLEGPNGWELVVGRPRWAVEAGVGEEAGDRPAESEA